MDSNFPRVAVLGAGAVGTWVGASLAVTPLRETRDGRQEFPPPPLLLGKSKKPWFGAGNTLLESRDPSPSSCKVPADRVQYLSLPEDAEAARQVCAACDIVLVAVKGQHTADAAEFLSSVFPPPEPGSSDSESFSDPEVEYKDGMDVAKPRLVVSLQNGLQPSRDLREHLPWLTVVAAVVHFNVVEQRDGVYIRAVGKDLIIQQPHPDSSCFEMFEVLVAHLRAGGMSVTVAPGDTILRHQYAKLVVNLHNGVNAVSGIPLLEMYQSRGYRRVLAACHEEALGLLSRAGIQPIPQSKLLNPKWFPALLRSPSWFFNFFFSRVVKMSPEAKSSTLQDLEAGKSTTEIDLLNGEFVRLGHALERRVPVIHTVQHLVEKAALSGRGSPHLTAWELQRVTCVGSDNTAVKLAIGAGVSVILIALLLKYLRS